MRTTRSVAPRRARPVIQHPEYVAPRYHSRIWSRLLYVVLILALCGIIGVGGGLYWALHHAQSSRSQRVTVHVGPGDSVSSIADELQQKGLIGNTLLFRLDAKLRSLGSKLKVGDYTLRRNMSIDDMVTALTVYQNRLIRITIPEGFRVGQIAERLQANHIDGQQFLFAVGRPDPGLLKLPILRDKPGWAGLEGYLFPDTYEVPPGYSGRQFVALMVKRLDQKITPTMRARAAGLRWAGSHPIYRVLTLASIVEREARAPEDRGKIASVYVNRLTDTTQVWKLNADPTVQYVIGNAKRWWPVLRTNDPSTVSPQSPYNTYTHTGLPPGPIANPGLASIQAVLAPPRTNYYYFVAMNDCRHSAFASTLAQQQINEAKYHCNA